MRNKRVAAVVVIAMAAIVAAGGLMASNMGFKLNYPLVASGAGSNSGTTTIGLPYNRQVGIDTASQLLADIVLSGPNAIARCHPCIVSQCPGSVTFAVAGKHPAVGRTGVWDQIEDLSGAAPARLVFDIHFQIPCH